MNVHCASLGHESNSFSSLPTCIDDFTIEKRPEIHIDGSPSGRRDSLAGIVAGLAAANLKPRAVLRARAMPGGRVTDDAYERLSADFVDGSADTDGACVFCHGAMRTASLDYADADLIRALRRSVGPDRPIVAALDMHANITSSMCRAADAIVTYRTAPHIDLYETGRRAADLFAAILRKEVHPQTALEKVPILLPGEMAQTANEPMRSLLSHAAELEHDRRILSVSFAKAHCWADIEDLGLAVVVVADGDTDAARHAAGELASEAWRRRAEFAATVETYDVDESIRVAAGAPESTVFLSDSGDNPGAGGTTDVPVMVERLLRLNAPESCVAAIWDTETTAAAREAGHGAELRVELGGKLDTVHGTPLRADARVVDVFAGSAVIRIGAVTVLVTDTRESIVDPAQLRSRGIEPLDYKIVVLKRGYLEPKFAEIAERSILCLSPGCTNCDVRRMRYRSVRRPVYPLDTNFEWRPEAFR